jgi:hypothetical protein
MYELLTVFGAGLALLVVLRVYMAVWRWRCPRCGARSLRYVGTAAIYLPPGDGPWDIRFQQACCGACGRSAYRRAVFASWEPEMRAVPAGSPPPPLPVVGSAPEIVFDDAVPPENQRGPHE